MRFLLLCVSVIMGSDIAFKPFGDEWISSDKLSLDSAPKTRKENKYSAQWKDLDKRPLPEWFDKAKIGIMIHWGLYSVPDFEIISEQFWHYWKQKRKMEILDLMAQSYDPNFKYEDFVSLFTAESFDPISWAKLFAKAGAKYVILTSKHHDGFALFPSKQSANWNSVDVGPRRNLIEELAKAVRSQDMDFGIYYSFYEWYKAKGLESKSEESLNVELINLIRDIRPTIIWVDGVKETTDDDLKTTQWNTTTILSWLFNASPVKDKVVVNDRWDGTICEHGDFDTCKDEIRPGFLQKRKWEKAFTMDRKSWSYRGNIRTQDVLSTHAIIRRIVRTVSCGGNALINIGPTPDGKILPVFQDRLLALGDWLNTNGEAIYDTSPWLYQNDSINGKVWYTCAKTKYYGQRPSAKPLDTEIVTAVFATLLKWPEDNILIIKDILKMNHKNGTLKIRMLAQRDNYLEWEIRNENIYIKLPKRAFLRFRNARAWSIKFEILQ